MKNNYLPTNIYSNSDFHYLNVQTPDNRNRVELPIDFSMQLQHRENMSPRLRPKSVCYKDFTSPEKLNGPNAIVIADEVTINTNKRLQDRKDEFKRKEDKIDEEVRARNKEIREKKIRDKQELEQTLKRIMLDALNYSKKNSPMLSMIPNDINNVLQLIQENKASTSLLNISNLSKQSHAKYEANAFLTALGVDIKNLTPETIKINVDMAFEFIKKWKVKQEEIPRIIRLKVTNEIMSVEGRRSVQKLSKYSDKINKFRDKQREIKNEEIRVRKELEIKRKKEEEERELAEKLKKDPMERYRIEAEKERALKKIEDAKKFEIENEKRKRVGKPLLVDRFNVAETPINTKLTITEDADEGVTRKSTLYGNRNKSSGFRKSAVKKDEYKDKKTIYDSYKHAEKICGYIKSKDSLNKNENLKNHFKSVRENKRVLEAGRLSVDFNQICLK